jgi:Na+/H+ antiporter NhaB
MSRTEREKEYFFKKKYIYIYIKLLRNIKKKIVLNYLFQNDTLNNIPASKTGG